MLPNALLDLHTVGGLILQLSEMPVSAVDFPSQSVTFLERDQGLIPPLLVASILQLTRELPVVVGVATAAEGVESARALNAGGTLVTEAALVADTS